MGMPDDYDDDTKKVRTYSLLLPQPKEAGLVPPKDLKVLANALGAKNEDNEGQRWDKNERLCWIT